MFQVSHPLLLPLRTKDFHQPNPGDWTTVRTKGKLDNWTSAVCSTKANFKSDNLIMKDHYVWRWDHHIVEHPFSKTTLKLLLKFYTGIFSNILSVESKITTNIKFENSLIYQTKTFRRDPFPHSFSNSFIF